MSIPNQIPDEALDNHLAILGKTGAGFVQIEPWVLMEAA